MNQISLKEEKNTTKNNEDCSLCHATLHQ